jgi:hypothetical protein
MLFIVLLLYPFTTICFDFNFRSVRGCIIVNVFILYTFPCLRVPLIVVRNLNEESTGGDGLWSVTVSHHDWWGWSMVCLA